MPAEAARGDASYPKGNILSVKVVLTIEEQADEGPVHVSKAQETEIESFDSNCLVNW